MNHKQQGGGGTGAGNMLVPAKNGVDRLNIYKCKECPAVCFDNSLHNLVYLVYWNNCLNCTREADMVYKSLQFGDFHKILGIF